MFTFAALEKATRTRLGDEIADRLASVRYDDSGETIPLEMVLSADAAGHLLALVCMPGELGLAGSVHAPIVGVRLEGQGRFVEMFGSAALDHQLVNDSLAESLGATLGRWLWAGADMTCLAYADSAMQANFWRDDLGRYGAILLDERGALSVVITAHFGTILDNARPYTTQRPIYASSFFNLGADAYDLSASAMSAPLEKPASPSPIPYLRLVEGESEAVVIN